MVHVNNDRVLLFIDWRYAWGIKNAMSRVVDRVSKAFCAMGSCIIPNIGCEGSLYNVTSTYKIPNYPHALSNNVCGDIARNAVLYLKKKMRIAAYRV